MSPSQSRSDAVTLLLEIARCRNVQECLGNPETGHPCAEVIAAQQGSRPADFQLPEPWSGDLAAAPILFLGSNPSIDLAEVYPLASWTDAQVIDFFAHRFGGGRKTWVEGGLHTLLKDGTHRDKWVRYWAAVGARASELGVVHPEPGVSYAMSEVVHCKSVKEIGVLSAADKCVNRYLHRMVEHSGARVIVALGKHADAAVRRTFGLPPEEPDLRDYRKVYGPIAVGTLERHFAFLPHPNYRGKRTFADCVSAEDLARLRRVLNASPQLLP